MKTVATIFFIIFIGTAASAQDTAKEVKVETVEMTIVKEGNDKLEIGTGKEVARLYKFKNSRIKKELSFATKRNSPKIA